MDLVVREQEFYRQNKATVSKLAQLMCTSTQYLSHIINYFCGESFPNYINRLRLQWMSQHGNPLLHTRQSALWGEAGSGSYSAYHRATQTFGLDLPQRSTSEAVTELLG